MFSFVSSAASVIVSTFLVFGWNKLEKARKVLALIGCFINTVIGRIVFLTGVFEEGLGIPAGIWLVLGL